MTDYLQRLVRRSQEMPGRTLAAPPAPAFRVASHGDIDDPFEATVDTAGDPGASSGRASAAGAAPPFPGPAAQAPRHAAEESWDLPVPRMADSMLSAPDAHASNRPHPVAPVQVRPPERGHSVPPEVVRMTPADTSPRQAPPADKPATATVRQAEPTFITPGAEQAPVQVAPPAAPPDAQTPPVAPPDELQTLLRRLQAALAPAAVTAPASGDDPQVRHATPEPAPRQLLAPAPAAPVAPVERRQLSIGRLVVEVTPPALPPPAARVRTVVRPSAPPRPQAAVSSKLRFGIGQL